ncbi:ADK [Symbiodinium sp. CCMP2592]|nr:ADK [Symbiodinium sp. CCMP2592]
MPPTCMADVIRSVIELGDLEALQRVTPADYDWSDFVSKTSRLPLVLVMVTAPVTETESRVKMLNWMVQTGADPFEKEPTNGASESYETWQKSKGEDSKIKVSFAGHCATTFACTLLKALLSSPYAEGFQPRIEAYRGFVKALTAGTNRPLQSNLSVPQSVVDTWESIREMTSTHNVIFETADGEVSAHDLVLLAASPVLKAMLESTMKEGSSKRIPVKDSLGSGVRLLVDMLYTSSTRDDPDYKTVLVALDLAHRWQATGIVPVLAGILAEMITIESFAAIAESAMLKGLESLQGLLGRSEAPPPEDTFDKYGLIPGNAILAEDKHQPLFAELAAKKDVVYVAGGATQNSIRVAQWMIQEPGKTAYMGCIGEDDFGKKLIDACKKDGVDCKYMIDKTTPTGACAVTIMNKERSLTTNLHAANNYKASHLQANMDTLKNAKIVYSAGFFITVSPESIEIASQETLKTGAVYCLNLSAPFIVQVPPFRAVLEKTLPCCDYLFGNETEARAYAEAVGWDTEDVEFIATRLSLVPMAGSKPYRKVVITQGADPTIVAIRGQVTKYPVIALPKEKLVDTNGAGDAFVGGFLAALAKGKDIEACCKAGSYSASVVIQHSGCTYPAKPDYTI